MDENPCGTLSQIEEAAIQAHIRLEESGDGLSFLNIFKAGAEWMASQGVTIECDVWEQNEGLAYFLGRDDARELGILSCPKGTKVIVQFRKK